MAPASAAEASAPRSSLQSLVSRTGGRSSDQATVLFVFEFFKVKSCNICGSIRQLSYEALPLLLVGSNKSVLSD